MRDWLKWWIRTPWFGIFMIALVLIGLYLLSTANMLSQIPDTP